MMKRTVLESPEFYTVREVAALLRIHTRSVIRLYQGHSVKLKNPDGTITRVRKRPVLAVTRIGTRVRISKAKLTRYLAQRTSVVG